MLTRITRSTATLRATLQHYNTATLRTKSFVESRGCPTGPLDRYHRIPPPAHAIVVHIGKYVSSEFMVQIKQKGVYGVEVPPPRSFVGG